MWPAIAILADTSFTRYPAGGTFTTRWEPLALNGFRASHRLGVSGRMTNATSIAVPTLVSLDDVRMAAAGLRGIAVRTPLLPSDALHAQFGVPVFLKPEMLQRGGAFKFRGAYWFLSQLSAEQRARGLVAPSSGNHGQAVALAAKLFGARATVVMPTTAPRAKREGAERLGARVILEGTTTAERMKKAVEICAHEGATLVPPFDDPTIIAGQGTIGLEIAEDLPDVDLVLVPVGGGGLSAERGGGREACRAFRARDRRRARGIAKAHACPRGGRAGDDRGESQRTGRWTPRRSRR